jgi:CDP-glucose 4,6-dehydratase
LRPLTPTAKFRDARLRDRQSLTAHGQHGETVAGAVSDRPMRLGHVSDGWFEDPRTRLSRSTDACPWQAGFWQGKRVLLTGHTGFKGSWAALWLSRLGASVTGIALPPATPSLCEILGIEQSVRSHRLDIRHGHHLAAAVAECQPELVLHMAAQPLVRASLQRPVETFETNLMGTVHLLQALRGIRSLRAVLIVTTDKVYAPHADGRPHREEDRLGGLDPYSASKSACELATAALAARFFAPAGVAVATARAGNVIGGGDFAQDRLVPDAVRAALSGTMLHLRNPKATRPWQHVLDCLSGYLTFLIALSQQTPLPTALNFGPAPDIAGMTVGGLASAVLQALDTRSEWLPDVTRQPIETQALALDSCKARDVLGWQDRLTGPRMIDATVSWYRAWAEGRQDMRSFTLNQIAEYEAMA